jgi:hypothetical protein
MLVPKPKLFLLTFLCVGCLASAQEGSSLGDVARKLRAKRDGAAATAPAPQSAFEPQAKMMATPSTQVIPGPVLDQTTSSYEENIRKLLMTEKYDEIDRIAAAARVSKARLRGGYWELHILYIGLNSFPGSDRADSEYEALIARLKRWIAQRPDSITARVALSSVYHSYAWKARGDTYADKVTDEGWRDFNERIQLAKNILHDSMTLKKDPEWYLMLQMVARDEGVELEGQKTLFDQAVAFEPGYQYFYRALAEMLMPRWFGEEGDIARFAEQASAKVGGKQGDLIYYHIGSYIWCHCKSNPEFESLDWPRIKRGYLVQRELYGDEGYAENQMARMAAGRDWEFSDELFTRINGERDLEVFPSKEEFEQIRQDARLFALGKKIEDAMKIADTNLLSPQGRNYSDQLASAFAHDYLFVAQQCAFSAGDPNYFPFRLVIQLGKSGKVEKVYPSLMSTVSECMAEKVQQAVFPAPPQGSYWATLSLSSQN